jgi:P4 family phage/plasmid primase-like protien
MSEQPIVKLDSFRPVEDEESHQGPREAKKFFDSETGFTPERMGDDLEAECPVVVGEGARLYRYVGGVYRPDAEEWIASRVREILGKRFKRRHREETFAWFKSAMSIDTTAPPTEVLNVSNGLLRWEGLILEPHRHDLVTTVQIPVAWNPDARCPKILTFLRDVLPDEETVQFVLEVIGYALYPQNLFHVSVLLRGPGRNGKSVLLSIILALLGSESVAAVPLQQFSENRFAAASLVGKLANICGDIDARAIKRTDVFKMLTGGDRIYSERKYGQAFSFVCFALPIFSANEPPLSADQSEAWFERWLVVPMDKTIPAEKRDPNLGAKLTTQSELEGLLVLAVGALRRLLTRGRFELPGAIREAQAEYRERLDSVSSFVEAECLFGPNGRVSRTQLRTAYMAHCRELELHAVGAHQLYDRIRQADQGVAETASRGSRAFTGVSLR